MTPLKFFYILLGSTAAIALGVGIYIYTVIASGLPSLEQLENPKLDVASNVYSSDGVILDQYYIQRRKLTSIDSIPKDFVNALVATEDREFYNHWGVHIGRIMNAMVKNVFKGSMKEGASTITQQLARNLYLNAEKSLKRKIKEAITAVQIEKTYTKREILNMYANTVYFGRGAYGVQIAAQVYFDKQASELTTAECAYLIGLLKAPEGYNAFANYDKAIARRNLVLKMMLEEKYISPQQFDKSSFEPIKLSKSKKLGKSESICPQFVELIRQKLSKDDRLKGYDLYRDGLNIYTTIDSKIQKYANEAADEHLTILQSQFSKSWAWTSDKQKILDYHINKAVRDNPEYIAADAAKREIIKDKLIRNKNFVDSVKNASLTIQTAVVVLNPTTGAILAMVGASPKFLAENTDAKFALNHAVQIKRQPGSSFKPFVYASAMMEPDKHVTPDMIIESGPYSYTLPSGEVWSPGGEGSGAVPLRTALKFSYNTVAARLITQYTSPSAVINLANRLGINTEKMPRVPSIALGSSDVVPLEIISAYTGFANQGIFVEPFSIVRVEDHYGNVLYESKGSQKMTDAMPSKIANNMVSMMQGVVDGGTGSSVRQFLKGVEAAGKTGTTNDFADAWFIGMTPQLVGGVWVGFDDFKISFTGWYGQGGKAAAPIWGRLFGKIYADNSLPYRQSKFIFSNDSLRRDSVNPEDIYNPPVENVPPQKRPALETAPPTTPTPIPEKKPAEKQKSPFAPLPTADKKKTK